MDVTDRSVKDAYNAIISGDLKLIEEYFDDATSFSLFVPITLSRDTAFHIAAYNGETRLLSVLLDIKDPSHPTDGDEDEAGTGILYQLIGRVKNIYGNNILHEVAASGKVKSFELVHKAGGPGNGGNYPLLQTDDVLEMLKEKNLFEETPLFRAAVYGRTRMLHHLINYITITTSSSNTSSTPTSNLLSADGHLRRKDSQTILHIAVLNQHFDTALWLLRNQQKYEDLESLAEAKNGDDMTCLEMLADMPSAFRSGFPMGLWLYLLYICLPANYDDVIPSDSDPKWYHIHVLITRMYRAFWWRLAEGARWLGCGFIYKMCKRKRTHIEAHKVTKLLLTKDQSWQTCDVHMPMQEGTPILSRKPSSHLSTQMPDHHHQQQQNHRSGPSSRHLSIEEEEKKDKVNGDNSTHFTLLQRAASNGITEMVEEILKTNPLAVEHVNKKGWNLLHVVAAYRKLEIFDILRTKWELPMMRLATMIDTDASYTVLHHVASDEHCDYNKGTYVGPALQLQDELHWFERVEEIVPPNFIIHRNNKNETARKMFERTHKQIHDNAKTWLKETCESCSTVAVLIAGATFAAGAFTVPGDFDAEGRPNLRDSPLFKAYLPANVVALTSSLISVVMFLSILTSPLQLHSFRHSVPRRLHLGYAALFISVAATMLAFTTSVLMVLQLKTTKWSASLIYTIAFLPATMFGLVQFPLYYAFEVFVKSFTSSLECTVGAFKRFVRFINRAAAATTTTKHAKSS